MGTLSDLRFGFRQLLRSPLTSAAAIVSLALGIGGTAVMFGAVDAILLRPLPYPDADRLMLVSTTSSLTRDASTARRGGDLSPADYLDYRGSPSFDGLGSVMTSSMRLTGGGLPEQIRVAQVSGNFFTLLGVRAVLGRTFVPADDMPGAPVQAVLSEPLWRRRYDARPDVIGRQILLSDVSVQVVGVAPAGFRFETPNDVWVLADRGVPRITGIPNLAGNRDVHLLTVFGRLRPQVSLAAAQAQMDAMADRLAREHPIDKGLGIAIDPLKTALVGDTRGVLVLLFAAVGLLLLIASVNVANLILVRTDARTVELAMRTALGASPGRLARQILIESLLFAACGGLLAIGVAAVGVHELVRLAPAGLPRLDEIGMNPRLAVFSAVLTVGVGVMFGLWPAWRVSRAPLAPAVSSAGRTTDAGGRRRPQLLLVSGELAIAQVLLVVAGLLLTSLVRLVSVDPGFDAKGLTAVSVSLPGAKYRDPEVKARFHETVLAQLEGSPGVDRVAMAMSAPMAPGFAITRGVWPEGRPAPAPGELQTMSFQTVSESYFSTTGIRLLRGRALARQDDFGSPGVVVVNEAFVRRYFPGEDPIGRRIGYGPRESDHYWHTIVGLVADTRERIAQPPQPTAYAPFRQDREPWNSASYLIKSSAPAAAVGDLVRRAVLGADADQPISRVRSVEDDVRESTAMQRFTTTIASVFAGLALVLALVGTFGMMSHVVRGRTREIGVRMALGATRGDVLRLVLGQAAAVVLAAVAAGLAAALMLGASVRALLYEIQPGDPRTLFGAAALLVATAIGASYVPVRRALAQNPLKTLRTE